MMKKFTLILICLVSMFLFRSEVLAAEDHSLNYDVEKFYMSDGNLIIEGWAFMHNFDNYGGSNFYLSFYFQNSSGEIIGGFNNPEFFATFSDRDLTCTMCYKGGNEYGCNCQSGYYEYLNTNFTVSIPLENYIEDFGDDEWTLMVDGRYGSNKLVVEPLAVHPDSATESSFGDNNFYLSPLDDEIKVTGNHVVYNNSSYYWRMGTYYYSSKILKSSDNEVARYKLYNGGPNSAKVYNYNNCGFSPDSNASLGPCRCIQPTTSKSGTITEIKSTFVKPTGTVKISYKGEEKPETFKCDGILSSSECSNYNVDFLECTETLEGTAVYYRKVSKKDYGSCSSSLVVPTGSSDVSCSNYSCTNYSSCATYKKDENGNDTSTCETYSTTTCYDLSYTKEEETKVYQDLKIKEDATLGFTGDMNKTFKKGTGFTFGMSYSYNISFNESGGIKGGSTLPGFIRWKTETEKEDAIAKAKEKFVSNLKNSLQNIINTNVKGLIKDDSSASPDPAFSSAGSWSCDGINSTSNSISTSCNYGLKEAFIKYDTGTVYYDVSGNNYITGGNKYYIPLKFGDSNFKWKVLANNSLAALQKYTVNATCLVKTTTGIYCPDEDCPNDTGYAFIYRSIEESNPFPKGEDSIPYNWQNNWNGSNGNKKRVAASFSGDPHYTTVTLSGNLLDSLLYQYDNESYTKWNNIVSETGVSKLVNDGTYFVNVANRSKIHCEWGKFDNDCDGR